MSYQKAMSQIMKVVQGVNINDPEQANALIKQYGFNDSLIDKFKKWTSANKGKAETALTIARAGKRFTGVDPLGKLGIDVDKLDLGKIETTLDDELRRLKTPSYAYENTDKFRNDNDNVGYGVRSTRASKYPDIK